MKSKILKFAVLACSLAFMNCDDSTSTAAADDLNGEVALSSGQEQLGSSGSDTVNPSLNSSASTDVPVTIDPSVNPASSANGDVAQPASQGGENVTPASAPSETPASSGVAPASSGTDAASSATAAPASSAEKKDSPVAASSSSVAPAAQSSSSAPAAEPAPKGIFLASGTEEEKDQMRVEYKTGTGPDGRSILSYPSELSNDQKHGIVVWGPGGGTEPGAYEGMIRRLASHGFVVIALRESPGDGHLATEALNWLDEQNKNSSSPLYGKLDMNTVGCSGHSMGGLESEQAVIKDKRVLTAFMNNSGDLGGNGANHVATDRSIAILYGEAGSERGNAEKDYNNASVKAPACLIGMFGGPKGGEGGYGHGSGSWDGMAATVAWMRWHLGGETNRKADFVGSSGKYIDGNIAGHQGNWKTQCKNF